ncbi:MAG: hypothetical protein FWF30_02570 [Coriobacteriia bacterium]|nr:hypothetical protein [Coriobacteriia bacterium]
MIGLGITVYTFTSLQLQSQNIKVAAVTADAPGSLAGQSVAGPFTALAQINAIEHHTMGITGGKTFAQLGNVATSDGKTYNKDVTAAASTDGQAHSAGDPLSSDDASTYSARSTAQQSSFLQASLYVSVLAFGVSVLIMVVGVIAGLLSISVLSLTSRARRQEATATDAAAAKSKKLQTATQGD